MSKCNLSLKNQKKSFHVQYQYIYYLQVCIYYGHNWKIIFVYNSQNKNKIWEYVRKHVLVSLYAN